MTPGKTTGKPKRGRKAERERTAIHEAGHTIIAHHFGIELSEVSIISTNDSLGHMKFAPIELSDKMISPDILGDLVRKTFSRSLMCLGGPMAEHIYDGEPNPLIIRGGKQDLENAKNLLNIIFDLGRWFGRKPVIQKVSCENMLDSFGPVLLKILRDNWAAVKALVEVLIQKGRVSGEEAINIIKGVR
jgi:hypothetical protein